MFKWKGQTFNQITSKIQRNRNSSDELTVGSLFRALPLDIYRREMVTGDNTNGCNIRTSTSIDLLNMPNGSIINSTASSNLNGLVNTLDINLTTNKYENGVCNSTANCFNPAANARRKLRSSGMIKRQFDITKNNDTYSTSTSQYLSSRNRTFQQNQYNFIRQGNASVVPGDALSSQNIYSSNGINHCQKYFIPMDTSFQYQWLDANYYTVSIPSGHYTLDDINHLFQYTMSQNFHYYVNKVTKSSVYLMNFAYNTFYGSVELQVRNTNNNIFSPSNYSMPLDPDKQDGSLISTWATPGAGLPAETIEPSLYPVIVINNNIFQQAIGYNAGRYPKYELRKNLEKSIYQLDLSTMELMNTALFNANDIDHSGNLNSEEFQTILHLENFMYGIIKEPIGWSEAKITEFTALFSEPSMELPQFVSLNILTYMITLMISKPVVFLSTTKPQIQPLYVPIYYKPNNPNFAQQGGVSCSTSTSKVRYDAITNNSEIYRKAYGMAVANALAYGVPAGGYTAKDKSGIPIQKTPTFSKVDGSMIVCQTSKQFNG